jgi:Cu2+-exporting ATPase
VLVVSCPCALSLATPSALAAATDRLLGKGVLIVRPHVLETLHRATHIVFDKTGTLTEGRPSVQRIAPLATVSADQCLRIAAALETFSAHPLARAFGASQTGGPAATKPYELPGHGVEAYIGNCRYRIGNAIFVAGVAGAPVPSGKDPDSETGTIVWLGTEGRWLARFVLGDALRLEARAVVAEFRAQGKEVILLSGDRQEIADAVAHQLGIQQALGSCLPDQKLQYVQGLQAHGAVIAMIGDGINDAAVLSAADVSFAMGSGAALAQANADCVLLDARLSLLAETAQTASKTMRIIRQNLSWSALYNVTAIPAAALGLLNPWLSGIGMAASSAIVILNALRLRRIKAWKPSTY